MRILTTLCCAALAFASQAQTTFSRSYQLARPTFIRGSALTPDGGLVLCGYASDGADSVLMGRGFIMRTDASGNLLWLREHDGGTKLDGQWSSPFSQIAYNDIHANPDSSYLLVGSAFESYYWSKEYLVMGLDPWGDTLWTRFPYGGSMIDSYLHITAATNGSAFVSGYSATGITDVVRVEKMDVQTGLKSAMSSLGLYNPGIITSLRTTLDSGSIAAGYTSDPGLALWLCRSDSNLDTLWLIAFDLAWPNGVRIIAEEAPDASIWGCVVPGAYSLPTKPFHLVHVTAGGIINSSTTYQLPGTPVPADMHIKPNGKILVAGTGYVDTVGDSSYAFLMQVDPSGTVDWAWRYDGEPGDSLKVKTMEILPSTGDVYLIGSARTGRPLIIRTDSLGLSSSCPQQAISPVLGSTAWTMGTLFGQQDNYPPEDFDYRFDPNDSLVYAIEHAQCTPASQLYHANGTVFYDADGSGVMDSGEVGLSWYPVGIAPSSVLLFSDNSGAYGLLTDVPDTYTITPAAPQQWWTLSSDSSAYHPTFTAIDTLFEDLDFGYAVAFDTTILVGTLVAGSNCYFPFNQRIRVRNLGTTRPQGVVSYTYDTSMQLLNTVPTQDSIVGQTIYWHFDSLWFGAVVDIDMEFQLIPFTWVVGDTLNTGFTVFTDDGLGNLSIEAEGVRALVITCSYDPNNKEVLQEQFIPADQDWLNYTINFQNTGTDTAYTVVIEDQLSQHLQWNTLQFLGASHDLSGLSIGPWGKASFRFDDIVLPDSNVNELASHGFISYRIKPQAGLAHGTLIENNAGIFFDMNLPVVTNTTRNLIVDCATAYQWPIWVVGFANDIFAGTNINDTLTYTYQWYLDGLPIPGAIGTLQGGGQAYHAAATSGTYAVELSDNFGCVTLSDPYSFVITAVGDANTRSMAVLPNPFTNATRLLCNEVLDTNTRIDLVDVHGRLVRTLQGNGTREVLIERGDLGSGLYTVRMMDDAGMRAAVRIVVE